MEKIWQKLEFDGRVIVPAWSKTYRLEKCKFAVVGYFDSALEVIGVFGSDDRFLL